jgi:ribonuclease D
MHKLFLEDIPADLEMVGDIAIDTETLGLKIKRDRLCLIQIADSAGNIFLIKYGSSQYNSPNLVKILTDKTRVKIFHYGRFDVAVLMNAFGISEISPLFCTKIASKLTRTYTDFHGLKTICRELLGVELDKESQTSNWAAETLTEKQIKYAINDVLFLHRLRDNLQTSLKTLKREELAEESFEFINTICKMDLLGFDPATIINH